MKPVIIIVIAFVLLIPIPVFADPHTIETANDSGLNLECGTQCYTPNTLTVDVGHIVTMTNTDKTGIHTFTSGNVYGFTAIPDGEFDSGILNFGESFDYNANTVGKFPFYCSLHVWMRGVFIIQEAEAEEETMMEETAEEAEIILQLIPEPTPEIIPEPTPELIPEPISEPTPELIPELTPEPITVPTPKLIPEPTPEPIPTCRPGDILQDGVCIVTSPQPNFANEEVSNDESEIITDVSSNNKILWVLVIISFIIMGFVVFKKKTQNQKVENS